MPKFYLVLWAFLAMAASVFAQQNPVLIRMNSKEITRLDFEQVYNKGNHPEGTDWKSLDTFVDSFVDYQLKVAAAEAAGLDTLRAICELKTEYRRKLAGDFLMNGSVEEESIAELSTGTSTSLQEVVWITQIFQRIPQTATSFRLREAETRMDSIYQVLIDNPQLDFSILVNKFSNSKDTLFLTKLHSPEEFENVIFALHEGEVSKPFFTAQGLHLVKLLKRMNATSLNKRSEEIANRYLIPVVSRKLDELKEKYHYSPVKVGLDDLLANGETDKVLFTLDGYLYTGKEFERFAEIYPQGLKKQYDAFVTKSVFDYENSRLEQNYTEFAQLLNSYNDSILVAEITRVIIDVPMCNDEAGLSDYFEEHKSHFKWEQPRFSGVVLHSKEKKILKVAKKIVKKFPENEWESVLQRAFNSVGEKVVKIEQGLFPEGSNAYVDQFVFKRGNFIPTESYPFTTVIGEKKKGPDTLAEDRERVFTGYREYLMSQWLMKLRVGSKVEINEEVLKSVNNH